MRACVVMKRLLAVVVAICAVVPATASARDMPAWATDPGVPGPTLPPVGVPMFVGGWALSQLWLFWIAPILGAAAAGVAYKTVSGAK